MATSFFSIYSDTQDENSTVATKNVKMGSSNAARLCNTKRAALGTLTNVSNVGGVRKQPSRAAKQVYN